MKKYIWFLVSTIITLLLILPPPRVAGQMLDSGPLLISEFQTGGLANSAEDGRQEFIELYNASPEPLNVEKWQLQYFSAQHNGTAPPTRILFTFASTIAPHSFVLIGTPYITSVDGHLPSTESPSGLLAKSGGHLRVANAEGIVDAVSWGTAEGFQQWPKVQELQPGTSVQRLLPHEIGYSPRTFKAATQLVTPYSGPLVLNDPEIPINNCKSVVVSEILSNPEGADSGKEFIELHNPTPQPVTLMGCQLRLGSTDKVFQLPEKALLPGQYLALHDSETGLVLPNATAQPLTLVTASDELLYTYPDGLADNTSWALIDGQWVATTQPTPGAPNVAPLVTTSLLQATETVSVCPPGKERNPATNRCRNIPVPKLTASCAAHQERNPATGRCRGKTATTGGSIPCKPGQSRNPATNRCRSVLTASNGPKPCPTGQERNATTHRCRKVLGSQASTLAQVTDVSSNSKAQQFAWWIAGLVAVAALGYALYEWRQDVQNAIHALKNKLRHKVLNAFKRGKKQ